MGGDLNVWHAILAFVLGVFGLIAIKLTNVKQLMVRINELTKQVFDLQQHELDLTKQNADLKANVVAAILRIRNLETQAPTRPHELRQGIIVADLKGIIREYSPSLVPLFKWLRKELIGKPITILMPPKELAEHACGFDKLTSSIDWVTRIDPNKVILTYGMDRTGMEFPIAITLDGWQVGETGLITATFRELVSAEPVKRDSWKIEDGSKPSSPTTSSDPESGVHKVPPIPPVDGSGQHTPLS